MKMGTKNFIGKKYYEVEDQLENNGHATTKTIFKKKIKIGYDKEEGKEFPVFLECIIEEVDLSTEVLFRGDNNKITNIGNTTETIDHKQISKYKELLIEGTSMNYGGQIFDHIKDLDGAIPELKRIIELWKEWHLNTMRPNCIHQEAFNCNVVGFEKSAKIETAKCPKGYSYGSKWLVKELPDEIVTEIMRLFKNYKVCEGD